MRLPVHAGHVLGLGAALMLPMGQIAYRGIAPLFVAVVILCLATWTRRRPDRSELLAPVSISLVALAAWAILSAAWSITPGVSVETGLALLGTLTGGIVVAATARSMTDAEGRTFVTWLIWGGAAGFGIMGLDLVLDGLLFRPLMAAKGYSVADTMKITTFMGPWGAVAACFAGVWAWALMGRAGWTVAAAGLILAATVVAQVEADTPVYGLAAGVLGGGVFVLCAKASAVWFRRLGAAALAAYVLGFPWLIAALPNIAEILRTIPHVPQSILYTAASLFHRITIWQTAVAHTREQPVFGLGFDTTRALYDSSDRVVQRYVDETGRQIMGSNFEPIPLHTHNAVLQVWLELGLVGAAITVAIAALTFRFVAAVPAGGAFLFRAATFVTCLAIMSVSFGIWQSWWLCSLLMVAAFVAALDQRTGASTPNRP